MFECQSVGLTIIEACADESPQYLLVHYRFNFTVMRTTMPLSASIHCAVVSKT